VKRTPLLRFTALKRKGRIKYKPRRPKPGDDPEYLAYLRRLPCVVCRAPAPSEPSHVGTTRKGTGIKCLDREAVPSCREHHEDWHACRGMFAGWNRDRRRLWALAVVAETQTAYLAAQTHAGAVFWTVVAVDMDQDIGPADAKAMAPWARRRLAVVGGR
jgi:hypothetical protein